MKKLILSISLIAAFWLPLFSQVKVSILGDSYSTFKGWIPERNEPWYGPEMGNDVQDVTETWWYRLIADNGFELDLNNSWSGATICNTGYNGEDYTERSFLTRADNLGESPDIIYVFGGTNDAWAGSPLGDADGDDMFTVRPAAKAMIKKLKASYPDALSIFIINTELSPEVEKAIIDACEAEDFPYFKLEAIDKQVGHPSVNGMKQIASQTWKVTAPLLYTKLRNSK